MTEMNLVVIVALARFARSAAEIYRRASDIAPACSPAAQPRLKVAAGQGD